jgi:hypothetical protein
MANTGPPDGAFADPLRYGQLYWDPWFPQHCYHCHIQHVQPQCGVHCGEYFSEEKLEEQ